QTGQAERTANSYRAPQDARREVRESRQLTRAPGQHYASTRLSRKRRGRKTVAHHFQDLLDPWTNDSHERCARNKLRRLTLVIFDRRYGDHVPFIRSTS